MRNIHGLLLLTAMAIFGAFLGAGPAFAADLGTTTERGHVYASHRYCQQLWRCGPGGCDWYKVCTRPCPDKYSCYPLYGAYDPYGGTQYWGAYTDSGWSYYR